MQLAARIVARGDSVAVVTDDCCEDVGLAFDKERRRKLQGRVVLAHTLAINDLTTDVKNKQRGKIHNVLSNSVLRVLATSAAAQLYLLVQNTKCHMLVNSLCAYTVPLQILTSMVLADPMTLFQLSRREIISAPTIGRAMTR